MVHRRNPSQVRYWTTEHLNDRACGHLEMPAFAHAATRSPETAHTSSAGVAERLTTSHFSLWTAEQPRYRPIGQANIRWTGHAKCLTLPVFHTRRGEKLKGSTILMAEWRTIQSARMPGVPVAVNRNGGAQTPQANPS
jgi:hypothetical protein